MHSTLTLQRLNTMLLEAYGPQGWWPLLDYAGNNPTASGSLGGYHPGRYDLPQTDRQRFEICVGAVLTQNTSWTNVEKALLQLQAVTAFSPDAILQMPAEQLAQAIRPSGYYNTKCRKLRCLAEFLQKTGSHTPTREDLLQVWGIGPETADSILLYAYAVPEMVVDAYTRRILAHLGLVPEHIGYEELKQVCERQIVRDVIVRQEFHALMVEHAKRCYARRPYRDWLDSPDSSTEASPTDHLAKQRDA